MIHEIKVGIYDDESVIVIADVGATLYSPKVACEIAQSLITAAKEIDPTMDVETVMKNYRESQGESPYGSN